VVVSVSYDIDAAPPSKGLFFFTNYHLDFPKVFWLVPLLQMSCAFLPFNHRSCLPLTIPGWLIPTANTPYFFLTETDSQFPRFAPGTETFTPVSLSFFLIHRIHKDRIRFPSSSNPFGFSLTLAYAAYPQ